MTNKNMLFSLFLTILFIILPVGSADILSVNYGGSNQIVASEGKYISVFYEIPLEVAEEVVQQTSSTAAAGAVTAVPEKPSTEKGVFSATYLILALMLLMLGVGMLRMKRAKRKAIEVNVEEIIRDEEDNKVKTTEGTNEKIL